MCVHIQEYMCTLQYSKGIVPMIQVYIYTGVLEEFIMYYL